MREELDRRVGCSNSPELVRQLRELRLEIVCNKISVLDRDGKVCRSGRYELTPESLNTLREWGLVDA